jgi:hypothetical protein
VAAFILALLIKEKASSNSSIGELLRLKTGKK